MPESDVLPQIIKRREGLKTARSKPLYTSQIWFQVCDQKTNSKTFPSDLTMSSMIQFYHNIHKSTTLSNYRIEYLDIWHVMWPVKYNQCCMPNWQRIVCIRDVGSNDVIDCLQGLSRDRQTTAGWHQDRPRTWSPSRCLTSYSCQIC